MFKIWIKIDIFYIGKKKCIAIKTCYFWIDIFFVGFNCQISKDYTRFKYILVLWNNWKRKVNTIDRYYMTTLGLDLWFYKATFNNILAISWRSVFLCGGEYISIIILTVFRIIQKG